MTIFKRQKVLEYEAVYIEDDWYCRVYKKNGKLIQPDICKLLSIDATDGPFWTEQHAIENAEQSIRKLGHTPKRIGVSGYL